MNQIMKQDTTLSDLFLSTAVRFDAVDAVHLHCICPSLADNPTAKVGFVVAFKPENRAVGDRWFDDYWYDARYSQEMLEAIKSHRIIALLFMHELAKDYEEKLQNSEIA